jgi:hypothetical protein
MTGLSIREDGDAEADVSSSHVRYSSDVSYHENNHPPHEPDLQTQPSVSEQRATAGLIWTRTTSHCVHRQNYDEGMIRREGEHECLVEQLVGIAFYIEET